MRFIAAAPAQFWMPLRVEVQEAVLVNVVVVTGVVLVRAIVDRSYDSSAAHHACFKGPGSKI